MPYDKPFCTIGAAGRCWHGYEEKGWMPPIEPPEDYYTYIPSSEEVDMKLTIKKELELLANEIEREKQQKKIKGIAV